MIRKHESLRDGPRRDFVNPVNMPRLAFLVCLVVASPPVPAESARADEQDRFIAAAMEKHHIPGLAVAVIRKGMPPSLRFHGTANLETESRVTADSVFRYQSISKQFTTTAVLRLIEQGKLTLDDPAAKHLENLPTAWRKITVYQLLSATSGIPDYLNDIPASEGLAIRSLAEVIRTLGSRRPRFDPGEDWSYSNTGFWLLAEIVSKLSGRSFQDHVRAEFVTPLEMNSVRKMSNRPITRHRVSGYDWIAGEWKNTSWDDRPAEGDGDLGGTLADLVRWEIAVHSGKLLKPESIRRMHSASKLNDGTTAAVKLPHPRMPANSSYGFGCFVSRDRGRRIVWTPGAGAGFSTSITRFPDDGLSVIVLSNLNAFLLADEIAREVGEMMLRVEKPPSAK